MGWGGWHRGSAAQHALREHNIFQFYFTPYSPELNPQEHIWEKGCSEVTHNCLIAKIEPVAKELVNYLNATKFDCSLLGLRSTRECEVW